MVKIISKLIIALAIFFVGFYFGGQQALSPADGLANFINTPFANLANNEIKVSLMLDFGGGELKTFNNLSLPKNATVFDLLKKVGTENNLELNSKDFGGDLGVLIEGIGDKINDTKQNIYWQYWVNNNYAQVGAGAYQLKNNDIVEWKYTKGQF